MRDLIDAPYLDDVAGSTGSTFTVTSSPEPTELVLENVDTRLNGTSGGEQFVLVFRGPPSERVQAGIHRLTHPRLGAFDLYVRPALAPHPDADAVYYKASFSRRVSQDEASSNPSASGAEKDSSTRRGFLGRLAGAIGAGGLLSTLFGTESSRAASGGNVDPAQFPLIGQIILFAGTFEIDRPAEFLGCDGRQLPIQQFTALFSIIGTTYGGDGRSTFRIPDLRARVPIHVNSRTDLSGRSQRLLGSEGGRENVQLGVDNLPAHEHGPSLPVSTQEANATAPGGNALGVQPQSRGTVPVYDSSGDEGASMSVQSSEVGSGQSVGTMPPFQTVSYQICIAGVFPSRN